MADEKGKIPKQRKEGEKGGGGRVNHTESREKSSKRGGNPYKDGAGDKKKPEK